MTAPLRLRLDTDALIHNWRLLDAMSGRAACGAAVKANGYGLGARDVVARLAVAGCRDFFVATWDEADALGDLPEGTRLSVLHGVRAQDMPAAARLPHRPVLNSAAQVARWRQRGDQPCDVMIDTGINRLGLSIEEARSGLLDGLVIDTLMSHLACADEPGHPMNERQRRAFAELCACVPARRTSLANSAGILLGRDYAFDLTRPGLGLYGGLPGTGAGELRPVAALEAQVLQVRDVAAGDTVGYGATWVAPAPTRIAIVNLGYGDGFLRALAGVEAHIGGACCPIVGRISMDLLAVDTGIVDVTEGDWLRFDLDLPEIAARSALSQYEMLTGLNDRFERRWC